MEFLKSYIKEMIKPQKIWLVMIFPLLYGIPLLITKASGDHNTMVGLGYWGFYLSAPTSYLVALISDLIQLKNDAYSHVTSFIAGTIQWTIILNLLILWISNSTKDKEDGLDGLRRTHIPHE